MNSLTYIRIVSEASMADNGIKIITLVHFFLLISYFSLCASVEGRKISTQNMQKHKNAIKTIQTENGDIVDCVSLYKQPALNHPLLKSHKIQMPPSWYPERMTQDAFDSENSETHAQQEIEHCPEGTSPILRTPKFISQLKHNATTNLFYPGIQDAYFWLNAGGVYQGIDSYINVWRPRVASSKDYSGVSMWVQAGVWPNIEMAGAGWMVNPAVYGDYEPRLTVYWTRDNFRSTGCLNLICKGFRQVDDSVILGGSLTPSNYDDVCQQSIYLRIYKDKDTGHWWMRYNKANVGYWPKYLFSETGLGFAAATMGWGGTVLNSGEFPGQTYTEMGSGHFPDEGYGKACYIRNMSVFNSSYVPFPPRVNDLQAKITNPACYNAKKYYNWEFGSHIFLGGNGASSPNCQ